MAKTLTSRLVMEVIDKVTGPARAMARSILGVGDAVKGANGRGTFADRLTGAIDRNNMALDAARGRLFDAAAGFYALRAAMTSPISGAMQIETALSGIASKAGLSAEQVAALSQRIREASGTTNQYSADLLKGVDYLVGMGMSAEDAATAIETIGKATTATGGNIEDMSAAAFAAISNLKVPAAQAEGALDAMAVAGKRGGFELRDMAAYMPSVAAAYAALGQDGTDAVADLAAAMQVMRADTGDASTAATNLQNVIQKTFAPGTIKKFAEQGVDLFAEMDKAAKRGLTPLEAIAEITNKTLKGDLTKLGFLFEDAQAQAGIRSLIQSTDEYRAIREEAMKGAGTNQTDFNRAMQTTEQRAKKAKIALNNLGNTIGSALLPIIQALSEAITPVLNGLRDFADAHPRIVAAATSIAAGFVALRVAIAGLSYLGLLGRGGVLSALAFGMSTVGAAGGKVWGAVRSSIALQAALAAMDGAKIGLFAKLAAGLRGLAAVTGLSAVASGIAAVAGVIVGISAPVWIAVAAAVAAVGMAWKYWDRVSSFVAGVGQAIGEILQPALEAARPILDWFAPLGEAIAAGWQKAKDAVAAVGEWFGSFFTQEILTEEEKASYHQAGYDVVMAFWNGMKQVFVDLATWVGQQVDKVLKPLRDAKNWLASFIPGSETSMSGFSEDFDFGVDGERAKGGPISRGRTYLVGEEGPELITASRSGYVNPNGSGAGGAVTFQMGGIVIHAAQGQSALDIAEKAAALIEEKVKAALRGIQADTGLSTY